jgi:hypothetical protein
LFSAAQRLARRELEATRDGPVFERRPVHERLEGLLKSEGDLPKDGAGLATLLQIYDTVLAEDRRTARTFFGYVHSPPSAIGVAGDLLA